jgi:hypothetical protein
MCTECQSITSSFLKTASPVDLVQSTSEGSLVKHGVRRSRRRPPISSWTGMPNISQMLETGSYTGEVGLQAPRSLRPSNRNAMAMAFMSTD